MDFQSFRSANEAGFEGFIPFSQLKERKSTIPTEMGVYLVLKPDGFEPNYLQVGTGGAFKNRDPNVALSVLAENWVFSANVLYIGKAGGSALVSTLRKRLVQYFDFGHGKPVGHSGGRLIWQLQNSGALVVCWKVTKVEPSEMKRSLIAEFKVKFGVRPFANLKD